MRMPVRATSGFRLGSYDKQLPLVIDPVLVYTRYSAEATMIILRPWTGRSCRERLSDRAHEFD